MAEERRSFQETRGYPVFFMIIVSIFFIGILALFYNSVKVRIEEFDKLNLKKAVLNSFNLPVEDIDRSFEIFIQEKTRSEIFYYEANKDDSLMGYCFPISGAGLWGTIDALLTLTPDLEEIINIAIIKNNETPGLGARITEDWFTDQFQGKNIIVDGEVRKFELIPEDDEQNEIQINQITGATSSSKAVIDIITEEMKKIKEIIN